MLHTQVEELHGNPPNRHMVMCTTVEELHGNPPNRHMVMCTPVEELHGNPPNRHMVMCTELQPPPYNHNASVRSTTLLPLSQTRMAATRSRPLPILSQKDLTKIGMTDIYIFQQLHW